MASIFTRIVRGELPAEKVYETETEVAFLDINPYAEGHTLVVPKREVASFDELPATELRSLITVVQTVTRGIVRAMNTPHYNLALNNGRPAGQEVFHVHFHIIPRHENRARAWERKRYSSEEMKAVAEKIRRALRELETEASAR